VGSISGVLSRGRKQVSDVVEERLGRTWLAHVGRGLLFTQLQHAGVRAHRPSTRVRYQTLAAGGTEKIDERRPIKRKVNLVNAARLTGRPAARVAKLMMFVSASTRCC